MIRRLIEILIVVGPTLYSVQRVSVSIEVLIEQVINVLQTGLNKPRVISLQEAHNVYQ